MGEDVEGDDFKLGKKLQSYIKKIARTPAKNAGGRKIFFVAIWSSEIRQEG